MKTPAKTSAKLPKDRIQLDPTKWLENYGHHLYNYALSRLGKHEQAEEVLQDTLLAAVHSMGEFQGDSSEKTWLFGILKKKICDCIRSEWNSKSNISLQDEANPASEILSGDGHWLGHTFPQLTCELESKELWQIIQACLRKLPNNLSRVFVLRVLEEKKTQEICNELEISATNLRARLYRARIGLARCVSENWPQ